MTTSDPHATPRDGFVHHTSIYSSDHEFLAMAVPFVADGLDRGEPVLVTTTPANLQLLSDSLGARAGLVDYAESAHFGRRPPQRVAAFHRYWQRHTPTPGGGRVRILAEPIWPGKSPREIRAWTRMEAGLNEILAATNIWMICPYDTRLVDPAIVADSQRTHPARMDGRYAQACDGYGDPAVVAGGLDTEALPAPPPDAVVGELHGELGRVRHLVATQAAGYGLTGERLRLLVLAVNEAAEYLTEQARTPGTIRTWMQAGTIVVDVHQPAVGVTDPWVGFRPPGLAAGGQAGLWLARQVCDAVEVRAHGGGTTIRLEVPGPRAEELLQTHTPYTT